MSDPRLDMDDPFGTRPDEKPPSGWDEELWQGVRRRIEERRQEGGSEEPPSPPPGAGRRQILLTGLVVAAAIVTVGFVSAGAPRARPIPPDDSAASTTVRVVAVEDPAVSVEWARRGRQRAGYVVLESLDPDVSYILIDPPGKPR